MAVRIQNGGTINFGTFGAGATITHFRLLVGAVNLAIAAVDTSRVIANGGQAQFSTGAIDVVLPSNDLNNAGYRAFIDLALNGTNAILVDAMVSMQHSGVRNRLFAAERHRLGHFDRKRLRSVPSCLLIPSKRKGRHPHAPWCLRGRVWLADDTVGGWMVRT